MQQYLPKYMVNYLSYLALQNQQSKFFLLKYYYTLVNFILFEVSIIFCED